MLHLADDTHHRRRQLLGAVGPLNGDRDVGLHSADLLEKVDVKVRAAEFSVGDSLQACVLLGLHDLCNRAIFDGAKLLARELSLDSLVARIQQLARAQEAADVIGAKRRCGARAHGYFVILIERSRNSFV